MTRVTELDCNVVTPAHKHATSLCPLLKPRTRPPRSGETDTKTLSDVMILWPQLNQLKRCPVSGLCGNGQRPSPRLPSTETPCHLAAAAGFRRAPRLSLLSLSGFFFSMRQPERNSLQSRHLPVLRGARDCHQNFKIIQVRIEMTWYKRSHRSHS